MILENAILKELHSNGLLIQQETAGQVLFIKITKQQYNELIKSHYKIGDEVELEFEIYSFYFDKTEKYYTQTRLISIL